MPPLRRQKKHFQSLEEVLHKDPLRTPVPSKGRGRCPPLKTDCLLPRDPKRLLLRLPRDLHGVHGSTIGDWNSRVYLQPIRLREKPERHAVALYLHFNESLDVLLLRDLEKALAHLGLHV